MDTSREEIAARAYEIWRARGSRYGRQQEDWLEAERELEKVSVILVTAGINKIGVVKEVRTITGLELPEAKELVERLPQPIKQGASKSEAEKIRVRLAAVGASVDVRPNS